MTVTSDGANPLRVGVRHNFNVDSVYSRWRGNAARRAVYGVDAASGGAKSMVPSSARSCCSEST